MGQIFGIGIVYGETESASHSRKVSLQSRGGNLFTQQYSNMERNNSMNRGVRQKAEFSIKRLSFDYDENGDESFTEIRRVDDNLSDEEMDKAKGLDESSLGLNTEGEVLKPTL